MLIRGLIITGILILLFTIGELIFYTGEFAALAIGGINCLGTAMLIKNYRTVGTIRLSTDEIIVDEANSSLKYPLSQIQDLMLFLMDVQGKFYAVNSISMEQGAGNSITFSYENWTRGYI